MRFLRHHKQLRIKSATVEYFSVMVVCYWPKNSKFKQPTTASFQIHPNLLSTVNCFLYTVLFLRLGNGKINHSKKKETGKCTHVSILYLRRHLAGF